MPKTIAYLRVSTDQQDLENQRLSILDFAHRQDIRIDEFVTVQISSRKSIQQRGLNDLFDMLDKGDTMIVAELSRLGRSLGQVIMLVDQLVEKGVRFLALKENITLDGKQSIQNKVMISMFGLFAEIERDLISERTKAGLAAARAKGKVLGRPKGALGTSKLTGKEDEIRHFLKLKVSKASIAKILGVARSTLVGFVQSRGLG